MRVTNGSEKLAIVSFFSKLPGVIFLDSTTNTVDQQLVEVLKIVLSHLQVLMMI